MNKLDALLEELEALDKKRTPGKWVRRGNGGYVCFFGITDTKIHDYISSPDNEINETGPNAAFIIAAVNTNAKLREIIRVQREALWVLKEIDEVLSQQNSTIDDIAQFTNDIYEARQAIEAMEKLAGEGV